MTNFEIVPRAETNSLIPKESDTAETIIDRLKQLQLIANTSILYIVVNMMYIRENNLWQSYEYQGELVTHTVWADFVTAMYRELGFSVSTFWKAEKAIRHFTTLNVPFEEFQHVAPTTLKNISDSLTIEHEDGMIDWREEFISILSEGETPQSRIREIFLLPPREQTKAALALTKNGTERMHVQFIIVGIYPDRNLYDIELNFFKVDTEGEYTLESTLKGDISGSTITYIERKFNTQSEVRIAKTTYHRE